MNAIHLKVIDPKDFEVIRVIAFSNSHTKTEGRIVYRRPLTSVYNKGNMDDFDNLFLSWLKQLNLNDVEMLLAENVIFDNQLDDYRKIYDGGRPTSQLSLMCHGDYTHDEIMKKGFLEGRVIELPIYWNSSSTSSPLPIHGALTFDKEKEQYFFNTITNVKSL